MSCEATAARARRVGPRHDAARARMALEALASVGVGRGLLARSPRRHRSPALSARPPVSSASIGDASYVTSTPTAGAFPLVQGTSAASLYVDASDWPGVIRAAGDLQADISRVTGLTPRLVKTAADLTATAVIIGTIGRSPLIDRLVAVEEDRRHRRSRASGNRSSSRRSPTRCRASASALVIAGSDKRGTIYGIYDLSEQIGVSPWYWWADVTPAHRRRALRQGRQISAGRAEREIPRHLLQRRKARPRLLGAREVRRASDAGQAARHGRQLQLGSSTPRSSKSCCG